MVIYKKQQVVIGFTVFLVIIYQWLTYMNTTRFRYTVMTKYIVKTTKIEYLCTDTDKKFSGKNVLSYSLFGKNAWKRYGEFIKNIAEEAERNILYKDWSIRIYTDALSLPVDLQKQYKQRYKNLLFCNIAKIPKYGDLSYRNARIWRYIPIADVSVDITCVRDLDSPLLNRESDAVQQWMDTDTVMHIMRDSPEHTSKIMGGLWCFRGSKDRNFSQMILELALKYSQNRSLEREADKFNDQHLLNAYIWPLIKNDVIQHDAFSCIHHKHTTPFPSERTQGFVGCVRNLKNNECIRKGRKCPEMCRPREHLNWEYC